MKKMMLWAVAMMMQLSAMAQEAPAIEVNENGAYELKEVVEVAGASAADLYVRAMEALSDWRGPDGKAEAGLDFHDKDAGVVNYKGKFSLGYKKGFVGNDVKRCANFILKVRCKDGKAQVTVTVPTVTAMAVKTGMRKDFSVKETLEMLEGLKGDRRERAIDTMNDLKETVDMLVVAMSNRLKNGSGDDDF